jgi:prepilin-type N-terminal cleavage/methylation domain-containing protein
MSVNIKNYRKGFTLIELLIVIAILGTLAVVVLIALNPVQQLARTRDAGRRSTVSQLGHAMEAYGTNRNGVYFTPGNTWISVGLVASGEIASIPQNPTYSAGGGACVTNVQGGFCYNAFPLAGPYTRFIVFARLESLSENSKCAAATPVAWAVYSSPNSGGGVLCTAAAGVPGDPTATGYTGATWLQ